MAAPRIRQLLAPDPVSSFLIIGTAAGANSNGDISGSDGTRTFFYDASLNTLFLNGAAASISSDNGISIVTGTTDDNLSLATGNNGAGDSGDIIVDVGTASGTPGSITIGGTVATVLNLGRSGQTVTAQGNLTVQGDLVVNGTTTTLDVANLLVEDVLTIFARNATVGDEAGLAFERGSTGDDSIILWNEANTRFELGLFNTTGGTTVPTGALASLADLRIDDLLIAGSSITGAGALTVTATGAILSLDGTAIQTSATSITGDGALTVAATAAILSLDGTTIETSATAITADAALVISSGTADHNITLKSGNNGAGDSGDVLVDTGTATGTAGVVTIGGTSAVSVNIGRSGGNVGFYGVAAVARSSAYAVTNVTPDRAYDANATDTNELADVLGTVIADLQALGLLGV